MNRTFFVLFASAIIMLIYTPSIQASENHNHKSDRKLLLLGKSNKKEEGASGLHDIEIADSPLLGTLKVSVLGNKKKTTDSGHQTKKGLVAVELDNQLLGKVNVDVLESQGDYTDTDRSLRSDLATVNVTNSLIGKVNIEVADAYAAEDPSDRRGGLVSIEIKETLVGNVNVDVLKSDAKKIEIVDVGTKDTPILGNTDIHVGLDKPSFIDIDTKKPLEPIVAERSDEAQENVIIPENPIEVPEHPANSKEPIEKQEDQVPPDYPMEKPEDSFINVKPKNQEKIKPPIAKPVDDAKSNQPVPSDDSDESPPLDFIDMNEGKQDEVLEEQKLLDEPVDDSIEKLLEARNKQVLNNPVKKEKDDSTPIDSPHVSKAIIPGTSLTGSGAQGSSGNSASNTGMGDLFAGKLDVIRYMESEITNIALFKVKNLRTKWNKEPPIKPPKQSFFLP
ncbi:hypothetical protein [Lederbergia panacisoli]|uniref:hypothetical protein n=1 Tax=Lederbergia panacisoli TaxID=1255251 RepID=UPI00214D0450|nr:hypothetical protein [Lederbergia panacisoli]MCR2822696.1 hypothetical protein [Lederbergia panacisoli]